MPERLAQRVIVDDPIDLFAERFQQFELEKGEIHRSAFDRDTESPLVDGEIAVGCLFV